MKKLLTEEIEEDLEHYDLVLLIDDENLAEQFNESKALINVKKSIKIYISHEIDVKFPTVSCRRLSEEEKKSILDLYYLYNFSDHFVLISEKSCYGGLFNYVKTGWLTLSEVFRAFLK